MKATEHDLEVINAVSKRNFSQEEIYTFELCLCNNEVDQDFERFPKETLQDLVPLFVGKSGILGRNADTNNATPRIYKAQVVEDPSKITKTGDRFCYLKAWAYMPINDKTEALIAEIISGANKNVSIGCAVDKAVCSICGKDYRECHHVKGNTYSRKLCWCDLTNATDAYEWAFVANPKGGDSMYSCSKETKCTSCDHREVCSLKDEFLKAQAAVDSLEVGLADREMKRLRDFSWIKPVDLECVHYSDRNRPVVRSVS